MPTVVFCSPKGGVGKTTSSLLLALQLSKIYTVTVIDADPNRPIKAWATGGNLPKNLTVVSDADEENILDRIEESAERTQFVIVDLEGTAAKIVVLAVSQANFVAIPMQGSQLDAEQANRAIRVVRQQERMTHRKMPFAVLLTRTNPVVRTRTTTHIQRTLMEAGIPVLQTELNEREAFRSVFSFRATLEGLDNAKVTNVDKAIQNVEALATEIIEQLVKLNQSKTSADAPEPVVEA